MLARGLAMLLASDGASMWRAFVGGFREHLAGEQGRLPMILLLLALGAIMLANVMLARWMVARSQRRRTQRPDRLSERRRDAA